MFNKQSKRTISVLLSILMVLSCFPLAAMPVFAAGTEDSSGLILNKNYDNSTGALMLESYVTGQRTVTIHTKSVPLDFVLVLDTSGSMTEALGSTTRIDALVTAATNFVDRVKEDNEESRIGIVSFCNTLDEQQLPLTSVGNNGDQTIKNYIESLRSIPASATNRGTDQQIGISAGIDIFDNTESSNDKVMILFTDGTPDNYFRVIPDEFRDCYYLPDWMYEFEQDTIGLNKGFGEIMFTSVLEAQKAKDLGAKVYSIGIFDSAKSYIEEFMQHLSSKYTLTRGEQTYADKKFESGSDFVASGTETPLYVDGELYTEILEQENEGTYYFPVADSDGLDVAFKEITEQVTTGGADTELREDTVLHDVITEQFEVDGNALDVIKVYEVPCVGEADGKLLWGERSDITSTVNVTYDAVTQTADISGFDYSENWCGKDNGEYRGSKLVVIIPIKAVGGTVGNGIATNTPDSGIIPDNETEVIAGNTFPVPKTDLPATVSVKVVNGDNATAEAYDLEVSYAEVIDYHDVTDTEGGIHNEAITTPSKSTDTFTPGVAKEFINVHCGDTFTVTDKDIPEGYTMKVNNVPVDDSATFTITANTDIVIEYSRTAWNVKFLDTANNTLGECNVLNKDKIKTADVPSYTAPAGYSFSGWSIDGVTTVDPVNYVVEGTTTFKAIIAPIENGSKYTVNVYKQNIDGTYPTTPETKEIAATVNDSVSVQADDYISNAAQYEIDTAQANVLSGTVLGNNSLALNLYLKLITYTVTWQNEDGTVLETDTAVPYGATPSYNSAAPTKNATAQFTYTFDKWSPVVSAVTGNATYTATFSETTNKYLITFKNDNGDVLQSGEVAYGTMPVYSGNPTKDSDAQYNYTFNDWDKTVVAVTGPATYTATYTPELRKYVVKWYDENGTTVLAESEVPYGETPAYPTDATVPSKADTAEYDYEFIGWTTLDGTEKLDTLPTVTGHTDYKAVYSATKQKYTVTWKNGENTVETDTGVEYGTAPSYDGATPSKAATAQYTYTFAGWSTDGINVIDTLPNVSGDVIYKAVFTEKVNKYTVTFVDEDGTTKLQETEYEYGATPVYGGAEPTKTETDEFTYSFGGWHTPIVAVVGNATYKATFNSTRRTYQVQWVCEGEVVQNDAAVPYGTMPEYTGKTPTKPSTPKYSYTFKDWDPEVSVVKGNITYTAQFTESINDYEIKFVNYDGTVLQNTNVAYDTTPSYAGATPTRPADEKYTYTFDGWNKEIKPVTGTATYTATYTTTPIDYAIIYHMGAGETNSPYNPTTYNCDKADIVLNGATKAGYDFDGWYSDAALTNEVTEIAKGTTGIINLYPKFTAKNDTPYTVEYYFENIAGTEFVKNADLTANLTGTTDATATVKDSDIKAVTGFTYDSTLPGNVSSGIITADGALVLKLFYSRDKYTVTWKNFDGTVLETDENVPFETTPSYDGTTPTRPADAQYTYSFSGWSPAVSAATANVTYTAQYSTTVNMYNVIFKDWDGTGLKTESVAYGSGATAPAAPTRENATFKGWDKAFNNIVAETVVTAQYTFVPVEDGKEKDPEIVPEGYVILTFKNEDGKVLERKAVAKGTTATYTSATPTKAKTAQYTFTFSGWDKALTAVNEDTVYTAQYTSKVNEYKVTFYDWNGTVIKTQTNVPYGSSATAPADPTRDYCVFTGWDTEAYKSVKGDVDVHATYKTVPSKDDTDGEDVPYKHYTVTFLDWNNTILAIDVVEPGKNATAPADPTRKYCEFIGWDGTFTNVNNNIVVKAKYKTIEGEEVPQGEYVVGFEDWDGTVLEIEVVAPHNDATAPEHPDRAPDENNHYINNNEWSEDFTDVTNDLSVVALYDAEPHYDDDDDDYCDECGWELHKYRDVTYIPRHYLVIELIEGVIVDDYFEGCPAPRNRTSAAGVSIDSKTTYCQTTADRITFRVIETDKYTFHEKKVVVDGTEIFPDENGIYTVEAGIEDITIKAYGTIEKVDPGENLTCWERFYRWWRSLIQYFCSLFRWGSNSASDSARDSAGAASADMSASADSYSGNK